MNITDDDILRALIHQVAKATPEGRSEQHVITYITRPMWEAWCRSAEIPPGSEPTGWKGASETYRVYGSETIVIESHHMAAVSFARS